MDGFDNQTNIIVMAATNRPDILDPALLRAGRFDRKVYVTSPTAEERTEIFNYFSSFWIILSTCFASPVHVPLDSELETDGFTPF